LAWNLPPQEMRHRKEWTLRPSPPNPPSKRSTSMNHFYLEVGFYCRQILNDFDSRWTWHVENRVESCVILCDQSHDSQETETVWRHPPLQLENWLDFAGAMLTQWTPMKRRVRPERQDRHEAYWSVRNYQRLSGQAIGSQLGIRNSSTTGPNCTQLDTFISYII
jgi:hypothetical protein